MSKPYNTFHDSNNWDGKDYLRVVQKEMIKELRSGIGAKMLIKKIDFKIGKEFLVYLEAIHKLVLDTYNNEQAHELFLHFLKDNPDFEMSARRFDGDIYKKIKHEAECKQMARLTIENLKKIELENTKASM